MHTVVRAEMELTSSFLRFTQSVCEACRRGREKETDVMLGTEDDCFCRNDDERG